MNTIYTIFGYLIGGTIFIGLVYWVVVLFIYFFGGHAAKDRSGGKRLRRIIYGR